MSLLGPWPRRAGGLPPGQRLLDSMPRFSDDPRRPPPLLPTHPTLEITVDGNTVACCSAHELGSQRAVRVTDFHCVTGWSVRSVRWEGVPLTDIVGDVGASRYAAAVAHDGVRAVFALDDLFDERTIVATHLDGRPLDNRHGAPLRLVAPHQYGYKNLKHLRRIDFLTEQPASTFGPKEHLRARVDREERHSRLPNRLIRVPYRLVVPVTAMLAERSLRRSPDERAPTAHRSVPDGPSTPDP